MPVNIPDGFGIAKLRWRAQGDGQEMISTIGFSLAGEATPNEVAMDIGESWLAAWPSAGMSDLWSFVGVDVAIGPEGSSVPGEWNTNSVGGASFAPLPTNCAMLVTKLTALSGRAQRGRMFIPPAYLGEAEVDHNGFLSGAAMSGGSIKMTAFFNSPSAFENTTVAEWQLFHSGEGQTPSDAPTPITSLSLQTQIATQRQRMRR